jgi:ribosome recycling factor
VSDTQLGEGKKLMEKTLEHLRVEFSRLRVGRATTALVEGVKVEVYGSQMSIKEVAALSIPDVRTIVVQPWDRSVIPEIEKGILAANVGLTPINDGKVIRMNMPPLTEERRKETVKQIKKLGEDAKVALRNTRRQAMDELKKSLDEGKVSEDQNRRVQEEIQKMTDQFVIEADKLIEVKSKEVLTV